MFKNDFSIFQSVLMFAVFSVPTTELSNWQKLTFSKIPPHKLEFKDTGMNIKVQSSAMPLIYPLETTKKVKSVRIKGSLKGQLNLQEGQVQGESCCDDFTFKLGFVLKGDQTLGWLEKKIAASWIVKLFELAPKGQGVKHILFLNGVQDEKLVGKSRSHPLKEDLLKERYVWLLNKEGEFDLKYDFKTPVETLALWLSMDGDQTGSKYDLVINSMDLEHE